MSVVMVNPIFPLHRTLSLHCLISLYPFLLYVREVAGHTISEVRSQYLAGGTINVTTGAGNEGLVLPTGLCLDRDAGTAIVS